MIPVVSRMEIFAAVEMPEDCIEIEASWCTDPEDEEMERMTSDEVSCISFFASRMIHYQTCPELEDPASRNFPSQDFPVLEVS